MQPFHHNYDVGRPHNEALDNTTILDHQVVTIRSSDENVNHDEETIKQEESEETNP